MPRTTGTRPKGKHGEGKGPGWGGPARGASTSRIDTGDYGDMIRALARDPANIEAKMKARELYLGTLVDVQLAAESDAARVSAAVALSDRLDGKAVQKQEIEAKVASHVIRAPAKVDDTDEWLSQHAPKVGTE